MVLLTSVLGYAVKTVKKVLGNIKKIQLSF